MIGGNKSLQAVDNKQEELLCRAMGLNYELIKGVHDSISPMDTPFTSKFEQIYRTWSTAKPQHNGAQSKITTRLLMSSL